MKTKRYTFLNSNGRHLPFALACLLIASAGWSAKIAVDHLGQLHEEVASVFERPSQVYLWKLAREQRANSPMLQPVQKSATETNLPFTQAGLE